MSLQLDILMYMYFPHQNQNLSYPILGQEGQFLAGISQGILACHGHQVCRESQRDTSHRHSPSSLSMECFLSVLEMAGRCPWEWSRESMQDILSCSSNNRLA